MNTRNVVAARRPKPSAGAATEKSQLASGRRKPGRPATESLQQFREHFLRIALEAFLSKGYEGASINAIALAAGISRDTFYRQYGSKEELFQAATGYGLARLEEHLRMIVATRGSVEQVLLRVAGQVFDDMNSSETVPVLRLIIAEAPRFPDIAHRMFEGTRASLAPLVNYLAEQRAAGALDFDDPFEAAYMLAALSFGGVRVFLQEPLKGRAREQWIRRVVSGLLEGWCKR